MSSTQLHYHVAPKGVPPAPWQITSGLYETLGVWVRPGWELMLTATETDYRAWTRKGNNRIFGKFADTAEDAALSLLKKLQAPA